MGLRSVMPSQLRYDGKLGCALRGWDPKPPIEQWGPLGIGVEQNPNAKHKSWVNPNAPQSPNGAHWGLGETPWAPSGFGVSLGDWGPLSLAKNSKKCSDYMKSILI